MEPRLLTESLQQRALELGFQLAGACPAVSPTGYSRFLEWLSHGYAGQMDYLAQRQAAYEHPNAVLPGVRSLLLLAMNYRTADPRMPAPGEGRIARYAWGTADYHDLIHERLHALADYHRELTPGTAVRGVVDTAPLLEREFAQLAGLGWIGKNTLLLNRHAGSYFFLAALLSDHELAFDEPHATDHCGTCRACLDACPTQAFPQPYVLDATRCISYLTIELKDAIPIDLRPGLGDWLFGCDICQDVCPWNHRAPVSAEPAFAPRENANPISLAELFYLDDSAFRARFRHTPLWRPKRRGLLRNAAIVLGNRPVPASLPALIRGLHDTEPLVRAASAWALGQFAEPTAKDARAALAARLTSEPEEEVRTEIRTAAGK